MRGGANCRRLRAPPPLTLTLSPQKRGEGILCSLGQTHHQLRSVATSPHRHPDVAAPRVPATPGRGPSARLRCTRHADAPRHRRRTPASRAPADPRAPRPRTARASSSSTSWPALRSMPLTFAPRTRSNRSAAWRRVALSGLAGGERRRPVEPVHDRREATLARHERHVRDLQHGVLQMRGHDLQVIGIESDEFQRALVRWSAHWPRHGSARLGRCCDRDRYPPPPRRATGRVPISG